MCKEVSELLDPLLRISIDSPGEKGDVSRHTSGGNIRPGDPGKEGANVGSQRIFSHDRLYVVVAIAGGVRPDDSKPVCALSQLFKRTAEGHSGDGGLHLTCGAANLGWGVHFWIKGFLLRRAAMHEEKDHRFVLERDSCLRGRGSPSYQLGEGEASKTQASYL